MINSTLISIYILIFLFAILYLNKDKLRTIFLRFKKQKGKYIKICPRCCSINIKTDFSNPVVWAYGTPTKYKCNSCGHLAQLFPEVLESEIFNYQKKLKEEVKEGEIKVIREELVDTSTGFFVGIWEVIISIILLPLVLFSLIASIYRGNTELSEVSDYLFLSLIATIWLIFFAYSVFRYTKYRRNKPF